MLGEIEDAVQVRVWGNPNAPTLLYLPGLHGDWTLIRGFRQAVADQVRFVELTYPRTLKWSLDDYSVAIESALTERGIHEGWLLAESFGSQIAWQMASRARLKVLGIILAGGFVRHPAKWGVRLASRVMGAISPGMLRRLFAFYAALGRIRYRKAPEVLEDLAAFVQRRTDLDRKASQHRLKLIHENDACEIVQSLSVPVFALSGLLDGIVPWIAVRPWLRRNCPALREYKILWAADHTVLATAPKSSATIVLNWLNCLRAE